MQHPFRLNDTLTNKISLAHLILLPAMLPFDRFYSELVLISFALHTLIHVRKHDWQKLMSAQLLLLQSVYWLTLFSTLYTSDTDQAFSFWGRQLAILLFPALLFLNQVDSHRYRDVIFLCFSISCLCTITWLYIDAFRTIYYYHLPVATIFSAPFLNHNFSAPTGIHATYLSMYAALSLYWLMLKFNQAITYRRRILMLSAIFILLAGLLQLGSRSVIISLLVTVALLFPFFQSGHRQRIRTLAIGIPVLCFVTIMILGAGSFKQRYLDGLRSDLTSSALPYSTADPRAERWKLAVKLIMRSPLTGYGSGDEVDQLCAAYFENRLYHSYIFRLNAHNQYLSFLLRSGLLGLLIWMFTLIAFTRLALRRNDLLFLTFLVLLAIVSLSENFLDVNKGIFFYAFFLPVLAVRNKNSGQP